MMMETRFMGGNNAKSEDKKGDDDSRTEVMDLQHVEGLNAHAFKDGNYHTSIRLTMRNKRVAATSQLCCYSPRE